MPPALRRQCRNIICPARLITRDTGCSTLPARAVPRNPESTTCRLGILAAIVPTQRLPHHARFAPPLDIDDAMQVYLVGGAVRDALLRLPVKERDYVVVGATPEQMLALGYRQVGKDFPVFLHPQTQAEYALARTERKSGTGYHGFTVHAEPSVTLEEDLLRRDLTINAIAQRDDGSMVDPYGGRADLDARLLRHVSPAFREDPLRVLRVARFAARFAALGFRVADETQDLLRAMAASGELAELTPERVWQETQRALAGPSPRVYFETLRACGALAVLFPEVEALWGVPQRADYHPEVDTGVHVMMVLDAVEALATAAPVRFAALTHDLGKAQTPADVLPRHIGHEHRSVRLVHELCDRLRIPNEYRDLAVQVAHYHGLAHRVYELRPATLLEMLEKTDAFRRPGRFDDFVTACEADHRGRLGFGERPYPQADYLRRALALTQKVDVAPLRERGLAGEALGEAIRRERVQRLSALKAETAAGSP
jgi:tRNA nucleotidyltransferase (CCA-adding enzyme)